VSESIVTITKEEYDKLLDDSIFLNCLRNAGVDNWEWYGEAVSEYVRTVGDDDD
jgi:hypothetical protein